MEKIVETKKISKKTKGFYNFLPFINCAINNFYILNGYIYNTKREDNKSNILKNYTDFSPAFMKFYKINSGLSAPSKDKISDQFDKIMKMRHLLLKAERKKVREKQSALSWSNMVSTFEKIRNFLYKDEINVMTKIFTKYLYPYVKPSFYENSNVYRNDFFNSLDDKKSRKMKNDIIDLLASSSSYGEELIEKKDKLVNEYFKYKFNLSEKSDYELVYNSRNRTVSIIKLIDKSKSITLYIDDNQIKNFTPFYFFKNDHKQVSDIIEYKCYTWNAGTVSKGWNITNIILINKCLYYHLFKKSYLDAFNKRFGSKIELFHLNKIKNHVFHNNNIDDKHIKKIKDFLTLFYKFKSTSKIDKSYLEKVEEWYDFDELVNETMPFIIELDN